MRLTILFFQCRETVETLETLEKDNNRLMALVGELEKRPRDESSEVCMRGQYNKQGLLLRSNPT